MSCRQVHPIVNGLKKTYGDRITFIQVNILNPDSQPIMKQYGFNATPELYLVNQRGQVIGFWDDVQSAGDLIPALDRTLQQPGS